MPQSGFFDIDRRLESISRMGERSERLAAEIPWELFRPLRAQVHEKMRKSAAGRKPSFDRFGDYLAQAGLEAGNGQIVDASSVPVPIQRNSREENRRIKAGEAPEGEKGDRQLILRGTGHASIGR